MLTRTRIALATAFVIGIATGAVAGGSDRDNDQGGFVMPGSLVGVNPAYHPDIFRNAATAKAYGFVQGPDRTWHVRGIWRKQIQYR